MKANKKCMKILISFVLITMLASLVPVDKIKAALYSNLPVSYIDDKFPASYMPYINAMKAEHPNWVFKAVHTGIDWNTAVSHESYEVSEGISLVQDIFSSEWKKNGQNYYQDGSYVTASKEAVAYVMDPRNFLNDSGVFMFEALRFVPDVQTVKAVEGVLSSTPMGSSHATKYKYRGTWNDLGTTYSQIIYDLSKEVGINPVHIASRIRQENSGNIINNSLINGDYGVYNFFNIGAYDTANAGAIANGAVYASNKGWTTVRAGLLGGIQYIYNSYVKWGQNTIYFERFDVNNPGTAQWLLGTGYMTNIFATKNESSITYNAYSSIGMLESSFEFDIPVYENMPATPAAMPLPREVSFKADNTKVYLDDPSDSGVWDVFPVRTGPDTLGNLLTNVREIADGGANRQKFTRIGIGQNTLYDKIQFEDGRIGYVLKKWIYEYKYTKVSSVSLNTTYQQAGVGDIVNLVANVAPSNAQDKSVTWSTSDSSIATVDNSGTVKCLKPGVVTITVKTKDQGKTATCTINIANNKVTSISILNSMYSVYEGSSITITPTIQPDSATNKEYSISVEDTSIAEVQGKAIVGKKAGTTNITFTTSDGGFTAKTAIKVIAVAKPEEEKTKVEFNGSIKVDNDNKIISGIQPGTIVSKLKESIDTNIDITIKDISGNVLQDASSIGTGTEIEFSKDGSIKEKYTVVIYGDADGNGIINSRDLLVVQRYILKMYELTPIQVKASIIDKTSSTPKAIDLLKIKRHILGMYVIEQ